MGPVPCVEMYLGHQIGQHHTALHSHNLLQTVQGKLRHFLVIQLLQEERENVFQGLVANGGVQLLKGLGCRLSDLLQGVTQGLPCRGHEGLREKEHLEHGSRAGPMCGQPSPGTRPGAASEQAPGARWTVCKRVRLRTQEPSFT